MSGTFEWPLNKGLTVINYFSIFVEDDMKQYGLVSTSGCGLPAKFIIHVSSKHNPYEWRKVIKKALRKAEKKALKTLAFPALGTGNHHGYQLMYRILYYKGFQICKK